jgi:1-acyl-sn-glycerol-3-phosphate acyltransferase
MQAIIVEKPYCFVPPMRTTVWSTLYRWSSLHARYLARVEKVTSYELRGLERFNASRRAGHGIMLAPNHSRTSDPLVMGWIPYEAKCHCYGMASWHLFQSPLQSWLLRSMGGFSVNREGVDRAAVNLAVEVLSRAERPLIMFPEGATSRTNDRLGPLLDGVGFIARSAAKRRLKEQAGGKVVVHPVAIKYLFQGDIEEAVDDTLTAMERRLSWPPQRELPLKQRILKVGSALLALKEIEFFREPQPGNFVQRMNRLVERLLHPHEEALLDGVQQGSVVHRVKALRMRLLGDMVGPGRIDAVERARRWRILSELYLAQQIDAYPHDYLSGEPTVDRMLEIVEKYEEDFTDAVRPHAPTKALIEVGEAIEVSPERDRQAKGDSLMATLEQRLQAMLDRLSGESPVYQPQRFPAASQPLAY